MTLPPFGLRQLNKIVETMNILTYQIPKNVLYTRPGPGGRQLVYVSASAAIHQANTAFGPAAWSSEIKELTYNFVKHDTIYHASYSAIIRVTLENGCYHEDIGSGNADNGDQAAAVQTAKKAAISDGVKRCLRYFGDFLGRTLRSGGNGTYAYYYTPSVFEELVASLKPFLPGYQSAAQTNPVSVMPPSPLHDEVDFSKLNSVPVKVEPPVVEKPYLAQTPLEFLYSPPYKVPAESTRKLIKIVKKSYPSQPSQEAYRTKIVIKRKSYRLSE